MDCLPLGSRQTWADFLVFRQVLLQILLCAGDFPLCRAAEPKPVPNLFGSSAEVSSCPKGNKAPGWGGLKAQDHLAHRVSRKGAEAELLSLLGARELGF